MKITRRRETHIYTTRYKMGLIYVECLLMDPLVCNCGEIRVRHRLCILSSHIRVPMIRTEWGTAMFTTLKNMFFIFDAREPYVRNSPESATGWKTKKKWQTSISTEKQKDQVKGQKVTDSLLHNYDLLFVYLPRSD